MNNSSVVTCILNCHLVLSLKPLVGRSPKVHSLSRGKELWPAKLPKMSSVAWRQRPKQNSRSIQMWTLTDKKSVWMTLTTSFPWQLRFGQVTRFSFCVWRDGKSRNLKLLQPSGAGLKNNFTYLLNKSQIGSCPSLSFFKACDCHTKQMLNLINFGYAG